MDSQMFIVKVFYNFSTKIKAGRENPCLAASCFTSANLDYYAAGGFG